MAEQQTPNMLSHLLVESASTSLQPPKAIDSKTDATAKPTGR